jgi:AAA+ ATPase superfamily predicted ATPase
MKFYNREKELKQLADIIAQSRDEAQMTVITGRRRIGKTELAMHCGDQTILYFFVARKTERLLCQDFASEVEEKLGIPIGWPDSFASLFRYVMKLSQTRPFTLIIDEFQEFVRVNPAVFSEIQREWDLNKRDSRLNLIISGSVFTLMKRIFEDYKEPLFGRANRMIHMRPFRTDVLKCILADHNPHYTGEDLLALFTITGGVPWYVSLLMDKGHTTKDRMLGYLTEDNSPFINEGKNILIEEFGPDYGMYFSILTCIAGGMRTRGEIEGALRETNISSYLNRLEHYYGLITRNQPIFSKESSKKTRYVLSDCFLTLWFRFFYKYQSIIANDALAQLDIIIRRDYDTLAGFMLERYFERKLRETGRYTRIGGYWDRKGENEIDLIAVNEIEGTAEVYEIKMQSKRYDAAALSTKIEHLLQNCKELRGKKITQGVLSLNDMRS